MSNIKFGDIEYFELLSLQDALKSYRWNRLPLANFEKLRHEVAMLVESIHYREKQKKESQQQNP